MWYWLKDDPMLQKSSKPLPKVYGRIRFLYLGRLHDIDDPSLRDRVLKYRHCNPDEQLMVEAILGKGIIVSSIEYYDGEHLRICRPRGITRKDSQAVTKYAIKQLGTDYNVRQIMDLARFMFPYWFLPKRWRSTLFEHNAGRPTKTVCSTMMAEAFAKVRFPVFPALHQDKNGKLKMLRSNSKLITPKDFDHSPFFDVIKYPILDFDELGIYQQLPWDQTSVHINNQGDSFYSHPDELDALTPIQSSDTIKHDGFKDSAHNRSTGNDDAMVNDTTKNTTENADNKKSAI